MTLNCILWLVLCSREDVSFNIVGLNVFNIVGLNVLEGIKQFYLSTWLKTTRLETLFKGDNVKALIKTSNRENLVLYFSEKDQKIAAFALLFWFSVTKQSLETVFGSPNDKKYPRYPLVLKFNTTCLVILYFLNGNSDDRRLYHDSK